MGGGDRFTDPAVWTGGSYELTIQLGRGDDPDAEARNRRAVSALWGHPDLDGCFERPDVEPEDQPRVNPRPGRLFGRASLPGGGRVACRSSILHFEGDADWLTLYVPMGSLGLGDPRVVAHPVGHPQAREWRIGLDTWLVSIAEVLARRVPFELALVGFEPSRPGLRRIETMEDLVGEFPPAERSAGWAIPSAVGMKYHPPTTD